MRKSEKKYPCREFQVAKQRAVETMFSYQNKILSIIIFCIVAVSACGYRFAGQGQFPKGVQHIFIEVFENQTSQSGIEREVTNQVIFEFTRQRQKNLASSARDADAVLKGVIRSVSTRTISRVGTELASQREVVMTVDLRLIQQGVGKVLWAANGLSDKEAYDVVENSKLATDQNENLAISKLSERISERIFSRLTNDF
jgi:outer membrane lipopolysaccharide assembly protein LptE/RlpB